MALRDAPRDEPTRATAKSLAVLALFPVGVTLVWLLLPRGPVTVALTAIAVLVVLGVLLFAALGRRDLERPPPREHGGRGIPG